MSPEQMFGYALLNTSTVTAIASTRIYHGMRPQGTVTPCINFFRLAGGKRYSGFETATFSVNCRAATAQTALTLARKVADLFHGTSSQGTYGDFNGFGIARASLVQDQGLIPETEDQLYNAPVDIQVVYATASVS